MSTQQESDIDTAALLPPKRQMALVAAVSVLAALGCGALIGLLMFKAPDHPLALTLANLFMTEGTDGFKAPGAAMLAVGVALAWSLCFILLGAFPYVGWLIYRATAAHKELATQRKIAAYSRAIAGQPDPEQ